MCSATDPRRACSGHASLVGPEQVDALLDAGRPSLAFFAAWAMQHRHGRAAEQVVERAMAITDHLPLPLRLQQERDIMGVLDRRMVATLMEKIMDAKRSTESRWMRELRHEFFADAVAEGEAKGKMEGKMEGKAEGTAEAKQDAVLMVLARRRLAVSAAQRAAILACEDVVTLDRWLAGAVDAPSAREVLGPVSPRKNARARPGTATRDAPATRRAARAG
jgi:hypothetical protein